MPPQPLMLYPPALNHIHTFGSRSYPGTGKAGSGHLAARNRPSYRDGIPKKRFGKKAGVSPRFHTVVASVTLGANVDGLLLGLQTDIYSRPAQLSTGQAGGGEGDSRGSE